MVRHRAALNARDETALAATLHFPYRLAGGVMRTWRDPQAYLEDFRLRAGPRWDAIDMLAASAERVHLDVRFTRLASRRQHACTPPFVLDHSHIDRIWAAQLRSSFAP